MAIWTRVVRLTLLALVTGALATAQALAGSPVVGSVAGSMNATVGGQALLPNTTIFSGDNIQVRDGVAVIAAGSDNRVIIGRNSAASFLRDSNEITVLLTQGNVSMLHPNDGMAVQVKVGEVSIAPAAGFKTLAEVAMLDGAIVVTAKEGALKVSDHEATKNVTKGQTIVIKPKTAGSNGGGSGGGGGSSVLQDVALGVGVLGAILAGVALSRATQANNAANLAQITANLANSAASQASSAAAAGASAAAAAAAAAKQAQFLAACAQDILENGNTISVNQIYGSTCPTNGVIP